MSERILEKLEPVRRRQLVLEIIRAKCFRAAGRLAGGRGPGRLRWQASAELCDGVWLAAAIS